MKNQKIKIAIVGVGNCASSLVQGLTYYKNNSSKKPIVGLMHTVLGGYSISDIEVVAAFDVNKTKVGKDLADAMYAPPNNTVVFAKVKKTGVIVKNAKLLDGVGYYTKDVIGVSNNHFVDPVEWLKKTGAQILINYLPVGSQKATEYWADVCLKAKVGMINCIPVFIASDKTWADKFTKAGVPIIGDDIKSQVGATIVHRTLVNLFMDRGMPIDRTYQLNVGGNTDFQNMLEKSRLASKKLSKTRSVTSQLQLRDLSILDENVHIGPSDFVPWLKDNKVAYIRVESRHFGDVPMNIEVRLSVEDSPNSAGVVIDAIRCMKLALNHNLAGPLIEPSAYFKKSPPKQFTDTQARRKLEEFIAKYS
ncbi:MAG TPA: inositol-3-phosphate synthase [Candidatus Saccharimonadales bacterium]|nr:inositol-3-phosphate synthase [Candidatus Saccharimonadales bacterium]